MEDLARRLQALTNQRKGTTIHLTFNQHEAYYETIDQYAGKDSPRGEALTDSWISDEQKAKAIAENSLWELQWYPDTPVGFYLVIGADLEAVIAAAEKVMEGER